MNQLSESCFAKSNGTSPFMKDTDSTFDVSSSRDIRDGEFVMADTYVCVKCHGTEYTTGEIRTTGSGITRFLNIQNQKYGTVTCIGCAYTEMYKLGGKGFGNVIDFFTN